MKMHEPALESHSVQTPRAHGRPTPWSLSVAAADMEAPEEEIADNLRIVNRAAAMAVSSAGHAAEALASFSSQARAFVAAWDAGANPNAGPLFLSLGQAAALLAAVNRDFETAQATLTALQLQVARATNDSE